MARQSRTPTEAHIDKIVGHLRNRSTKAQVGPLERFVRLMYARASAQDLLEAEVDDLYGAAVGLWKFSEVRKPGKIGLRVFTPEMKKDGWAVPRTVVELVTEDQPFLVDSVAARLASAGHSVLFRVHPAMDVLRGRDGKRRDLLDQQSHTPGKIREAVLHLEIQGVVTPARVKEITGLIREVVADIRSAVEDWRPMLDVLDSTIDEIKRSPPPLGEEGVSESIAFLEWMRDGHFTFLGCREYAYSFKKGSEAFKATEKMGLGILRDPKVHVLAGATGLAAVSEEVREFLSRPELLIVTKTKARSRVHRIVPMDYIGVKRYGKNGQVIGEMRFVGLFTATAYNRTVETIPLLRSKVAHTIRRAGFAPESHDANALLYVLDTFPRDELFQVSDDYLFHTALGILDLRQRPRIRAFPRLDRFERFASVLVYVPRELHTTALRERLGGILEEAVNGEVSIDYTQISDDPLARIHYILRTKPGTGIDPDPVILQQKLTQAARRWEDGLADALAEQWGDGEGARLAARYDATSFSAGYKDMFTAEEALNDITKMESLTGADDMAMILYRPGDAAASSFRLKVFNPGTAVDLSDMLPMLEHMGLKVIDERPHRVSPKSGAIPVVWVQDLGVADPDGKALDLSKFRNQFRETFARASQGQIESDGFNRLVLAAGLQWRQVVVIRAICKYLRQAAIAFSQEYMEGTLARNPAITALLVDLFEARFDPAVGKDRAKRVKSIERRITKRLDQVQNLDEDRILRRYLNVIQATLRTNFYQSAEDGGPKSYVSFKISSGEVDELPLPRPHVEIFVYSPRMEGVHLRGGRVSRGGIRWSDRREDFRTEILGLMKAQMVKNAVIVPIGAKGGFVVKRPPTTGGREAFLAEGIACYQLLMRGLLDVTDNQGARGAKAPAQVTRHDGDDTYLVVAADKGTATFSDIANAMSRSYGFWLDDAFASGGSVGYDHKKMGITARGAWESVKRHFREIGLDTQREDFTVVGIGDMAGDVFGNGMMLSKHIRLLGAFNHIHIFVDPDPANPAKTLTERKRLFRMPRSAWTDYDTALISKGGGVFERAAKSIPISPQMKKAFGITASAMAPNDLIRAMLGASVDLLWIGGIGTYVKASDERDAEVGDRANDALRLNGVDLRCKVVGEGGNLGFTQRGRIEFAEAGGRINTDAVDNSAGVDCSDHEVNIKILFGQIMAKGDLTMAQRDKVLASMTDEVADLVLRDNYLQSQTITAMELRAPALLEPQARFMRELERDGRLDRELEFLPDDEVIAERAAAVAGLFRPEISVVMAYAKNTLYEALLESDLPEQPYLAGVLRDYFPTPMRKKYDGAIKAHRLRREIVATAVSNGMVNRVGATFVSQISQEGGFTEAAIARAYSVVVEAFALEDLWAGVEALDNKVPAELQTTMLLEAADLAYNMTLWFLNNEAQPIAIGPTIKAYRPGIAELEAGLDAMLSDLEADAYDKRLDSYTAGGAPTEIAKRVAGLAAMRSACHIVFAANAAKRPVREVGEVFFGVGALLGLDWLRWAAEQTTSDTHWQRMAVAAIVDDFYGQQRALVTRALRTGTPTSAKKAIEAWAEENRTEVERTSTMISEFRATGAVDIARLALANRIVRSMLTAR
ncbi:MAG: NAD-glutamate dehydrogenase [Alphaproteobacteria bacterium]|jgi:glutamate dehydrogenase|nr:NAD-glutamate dehydrogenase [Alphaproteobacteria bacterium]MBT5859875.1 NAD-glutamate dehydrogenase [Alphaproteobacteria bacterium]